MGKKEFDIVVLGASGFTGRLVVEYLLKAYGANGSRSSKQKGASASPLRWAVGGRSLTKLTSVLKNDVPGGDAVDADRIIVADSMSRASMDALVARTRVVVTTVGPYHLYGDALVAACADAGVHCCDLTGEAHWVRRVIDAHHDRAFETGAKIVNCCGFDSIPSDVGALMLADHFTETHHTSVTRIDYNVTRLKGGASGGTLASVFAMMDAPWSVLRARLTAMAQPFYLNPTEGVACGRGLGDGNIVCAGADAADQRGVWYDSRLRRITTPFVMAGINTRVVRRSCALLGHSYTASGAQVAYHERMAVASLTVMGILTSLLTTIALPIFVLLAAVPFTRALLQRMLPSPGQGPSRASRDGGYFTTTLLGQDDAGHTATATVGCDDADPGYKGTAVMLVETAVTLARDECDERCLVGGVLTPASACGTALTRRLRAAGFECRVADDAAKVVVANAAASKKQK